MSSPEKYVTEARLSSAFASSAISVSTITIFHDVDTPFRSLSGDFSAWLFTYDAV